MLLSKVIYETLGNVSLRYQELLSKESLPLFEAVALLLGKAYFDSKEAETYVKQNELAQGFFQLAFESIMANSLPAKQHGDDYYVTLISFVEWWASKDLPFPSEPKGLKLPSEMSEIEESLSFREIVNNGKKEIQNIAWAIWSQNPTLTADRVIDHPYVKQAIKKLEETTGSTYYKKTYKNWISSCNPRPIEARLGRPKKELK
jgi:hypothetical protein